MPCGGGVPLDGPSAVDGYRDGPSAVDGTGKASARDAPQNLQNCAVDSEVPRQRGQTWSVAMGVDGALKSTTRAGWIGPPGAGALIGTGGGVSGSLAEGGGGPAFAVPGLSVVPHDWQ
jgi:hypothetical protein